MPFIEIANDGLTYNDDEVVVVAPPAVNVRRLVRHITIANTMASEEIVISLYYKHGADERIIWKGTLYGGDTFDSDNDLYVLDAIDKSICIRPNSIPTTDLSWTVAYGDASERTMV